MTINIWLPRATLCMFLAAFAHKIHVHNAEISLFIIAKLAHMID